MIFSTPNCFLLVQNAGPAKMIQKTTAVLATVALLAAPALAVEVQPNNEAMQAKVCLQERHI
jgi:preprotein translocase subunit SecG